jgi:hypothetical protein
MISFYSNQIPSECKARVLTILALQSLVITAKHLMRTNCIQNLQFQTSKHKCVWGIHAWYPRIERKGIPFFKNAEWLHKILHQCNYYDFRLLTSSSMPGNWIFVSDASDGCSNPKKKSLYCKHTWRTVPQSVTLTAIHTSKHAVLMTVCHSCSHDSNWNSKPKMTCIGYHANIHFIFTLDVFHFYGLYRSFFKLFYGQGQFFSPIVQNFCSCYSKYK